jgi:hypothetical protein
MRLAIAKFRAKRAIARSFDWLGWRPVRSTPVDLRAETGDPIAGSYLVPGRPFLIDVPLDRCRSREFHLGPDSQHPFVRCVKEIASGISCVEEGSLVRHYAHNAHISRLRSTAELLGLKDAPGLGRLSSLFAVVKPWEYGDPLKFSSVRQLSAEVESRDHGTKLDVDSNNGSPGMWKATMNFQRLVKVYHSIQQNGYRRHSGLDGDIEGYILINERDWCFVVGCGHHRAATLAALGYETIPVRVMNHRRTSVRRAEVDSWPHVRSGLYTREQALGVFDQIFSGNSSEEAASPEWKTAENAGRPALRP